MLLPSRERLPFTIGAVIVLGYILLRAIMVPVIHDEGRIFEMCVVTGDFMPFTGPWDAGNHVLSTALTRGSYLVFGAGLLALRMWSILSFVVYARYAWLLGGRLSAPLVRWCVWAALLGTPFVLDFFSLFRGYGPAMALLLMALHHGVRYWERNTTRELALALLAIALATFGSLSLLLMWCAVVTFCTLLVLVRAAPLRRRLVQLVLILLLGGVPLVAAALFSIGLSEHGALYFGSEVGLFDGTLGTLAQYVLGADATWVLLLVTVLLFGALAVAVRAWRGAGTVPRSSLMATCAGLIAADLIGRVVLYKVSGVIYPTDRTAMQLVPLFLILLGCTVDHLAQARPMLKFTALVLLVLPVRTLATINIDRTTYWPEQAIPDAFFRVVQERQAGSGRPLVIGAYHQQPPCWRYGNFLRGITGNELDVTDFPQPSCDLLMIDPTFREPPPGFRIIARASTGHNDLMERVIPLPTELLLDSAYEIGPVDAEFVDLWKAPGTPFGGREALVEWRSVITASRDRGVVLVLEVSAADGAHLYYTKTEIPPGRGGSDEHPMHVALRLPAVAVPGSRIAFYLYNPRHEPFSVGPARLRLHHLTGR